MQLSRKGATNGIPVWLLGLTILLMIARAALLASHFSQTSMQYIEWHLPAEFTLQAKNQTRPILLFFVGENSKKSKLMETSVFSNKLVASYIAKNYYPIKVGGPTYSNAQVNTTVNDLYKKYVVAQIPTLVIITPLGSEVSHASGYKPAAQTFQFLCTVKEGIHLREVEESEKQRGKKETSGPGKAKENPTKSESAHAKEKTKPEPAKDSVTEPTPAPPIQSPTQLY